MDINWASELAELLGRLSETQNQLLALLASKRELLMQRDHEGLASLAPQEGALCDELKSCYEQRQHLLKQAATAGLPSDSIQSLATALPTEQSQTLRKPIDESIERSRLLRHESITQWVVVQRTMLHLSQILEIIATGGQPQPTYGKGGVQENSGALMDRAV
ncbi:MAG: flagellar protein FlgN [Planctomycetes bacterium]|nr:flagellar protein FlgN [Planctomycetota bacterium]